MTTVSVHSVSGRLVRRLVSGVLPAGAHSTAWDGLDEEGHAAASGVYFVHLAAGGCDVARKTVLLN
jgi:flagellar hook assembly protein FlgD